MYEKKIKYLCNHCKYQNYPFLDENTVWYHVMKYGFIWYYYQWILYREPTEPNINTHGKQDVTANLVLSDGPSSHNLYEQMVIGARGLISHLLIQWNLQMLWHNNFLTC